MRVKSFVRAAVNSERPAWPGMADGWPCPLPTAPPLRLDRRPWPGLDPRAPGQPCASGGAMVPWGRVSAAGRSRVCRPRVQGGVTVASERVMKILEFRQAPFTRAELEAMTERDAWKWLYKHFPAKGRLRGSQRDPTIPAVVLSGMPEDTRPDLKEYAKACGFRVVSGMSPTVKYLVVGDAPGPAKMQYALEHQVQVVPVVDFIENAAALCERARQG